MLNIPIVHREMSEINSLKLSLLEEIEYKQIIVEKYWKTSFEIEVIVQKNELDGKFTITIKNIPFIEKNFVVSLNNKINYISPVVNNSMGTTLSIGPQQLKNTLFKDVTSIAIAINAKSNFGFNIAHRWERISELNIKIMRNEPTNKNYLINEQGLIVETYYLMSFKQTKKALIVKNHKSQIKILSKKIVPGKHNVEIFSIYNISKTPIPWIAANSIEGLKIASPSKKSKMIFTKSTESIDLLNGIVASICFDENTYYDFNQDNTYQGIGINSKKGYILPYKFKGDLVPILNINIGSINNILIGFSNPIKNAYFDKYSGLIKLKIKESTDLHYDDNYVEHNIILNKDFSTLISGNLSLDDIINLGKNEH